MREHWTATTDFNTIIFLSSLALAINLDKRSKYIVNKAGDKGSPCLKPLDGKKYP